MSSKIHNSHILHIYIYVSTSTDIYIYISIYMYKYLLESPCWWLKQNHLPDRSVCQGKSLGHRQKVMGRTFPCAAVKKEHIFLTYCGKQLRSPSPVPSAIGPVLAAAACLQAAAEQGEHRLRWVRRLSSRLSVDMVLTCRSAWPPSGWATWKTPVTGTLRADCITKWAGRD